MKHNRRLAVVLLLAAVILLTLGLSACRKAKLTPQKYLAQVMENTFAADTLTFPDLGDKVLTDIVWNGTADTEALGLDALNLKLYASPNAGALELNVSMLETSVALKGYLNESALALQTDLLGNTVYGTDLTKIEENYKNSIFGDPESMYYMGDLSAMTSGLPTTTVDADALIEKYVGVLKDAIKDNSNATLTDREEGGKTVSFIFNNDSLKAVIRACYDVAKDDADLRELVKMAASAEEDADAILDEFDEIFASEDELNELMAEIDKGSYELTLTVLTTDKDVMETATLVLNFTEEDAKGKLELTLDLSKENTSKLSLVIDVKEGEEETPFYRSAALTLEEGKKADGTETATLTLDMSEDDGMKVSIELIDVTYHEESGAFTMALLRGVPDVGPITVKGQLTMAKDKVSFAVSELAAAGMTMKVDVRITVSAIESVPAVPAYTDVFSLTEAQMNEIGENLMNHPLFGLIGGGGDMGYDEDFDVDFGEDFDEDWDY